MTSPCLLCLSLDRMDKKDIWHTQRDVYVKSSLSLSLQPNSTVQAAWQRQLLPSWNNKSLDATSSINSSRERSAGGSASLTRRPVCDMERHSQTKGGRRGRGQKGCWHRLKHTPCLMCQSLSKKRPSLSSCSERGEANFSVQTTPGYSWSTFKKQVLTKARLT